jgi:putative aldouronate transport system substrate-binding protein
VETEQSTVKNVIAKYLTQLEYGTVDVDTVLPEFLKDLENAGMNKIIEENQRQLNEWLGTLASDIM